ncbi:MAG TPA: hypothetical protein VMX95_04835 [Thermodesulfobacteriota bacterium]|nr:hypothetical protein [Thermodesulfobacteriota bacterium]
MVSMDEVKKGLRDIEENYTRYLISHFREWKKWAEQSDTIYEGREVKEEEVPPVFLTEMRIMKVIKEMETLGEFDWNNQTLRLLFSELSSGPFYTYFGGIIAHITIELAKLCKASHLVEVGAGDGRLTEILLARMKERNVQIPLLLTDSKPVVEVASTKVREKYPAMEIESMIWDIMKPPSTEMLTRISHPSIIYERYSLTYTNYQAIANLAQVGDVLVMGGWFNNTGAIYGYDKVFAKLGFKSLLLEEIEKKLKEHYPCIYALDRAVKEAIDFPNTTLLLAWR